MLPLFIDGAHHQTKGGFPALCVSGRSVMRKVITFMLLLIMCLYLGWTFYSRWRDNRALVRRIEERKASQERAVAKAYGGGSLVIMGFYANPGIIHPGQKSQLCYSVNNADTVRIEPPVKDVWPSLSRCVDVLPRKDTVYKLIAEDATGQIKTATTTVKVP
jgi:hypothetical protein